MATVTFLVGLCGSGKSYLAGELIRTEGGHWFDDVAGGSKYPQVREALLNGINCIVEEVGLCRRADREEALRLLSDIPELRIRWVYFENDLESANHNVRARSNKGDVELHLGYNATLYPTYEIPADATPRPIVRVDAA